MKFFRTLLATVLTASSLHAAEYHVSTKGLDQENTGSKSAPFRTISAAANIAQPGDVITVQAGTYRERINPPRGGASDEQRIVYQAAPGEQVVIKGSEIVTDWKKVEGDVWQVVLPNSFFGEFNPFADLISGSWFHRKGRDHHTGAVYLNGRPLTEAAQKEQLFNSVPTAKADSGYLFNLEWMRTTGSGQTHVSAADMLKKLGTKTAPTDDGGECLGFIKNGDYATYAVDFGKNSEHMEFRIATAMHGGLIEIRLDSPQGKLLGTCTVSDTGGWQSWRTVKAPIEPTSGKKTVCLAFKAKPIEEHGRPLWFAKVDEQNTTLWAQFKTADPNRALVEVNTRQSVFYPAEPGINYITVKGFTLEHAATPWAPPNAEQIGLIGTHWSKGWIIENNTIRHSSCSGLSLGKYGDEFDNISDSADGYNGTIRRALEEGGWSKETIGSHTVRNNHISHCGQAGIVGSMGCVFSVITGNEIHDIHINRPFGGFEQAGIKFHGPIDTVISHNRIYRCGGFGGIWLDWMTQGTRVTGNLLHDNHAQDLFVEVNHGPFLVDNNLFLSARGLYESSGGGAYVHNLINNIRVRAEKGRSTPFHKPHSTEKLGLAKVVGDDERFHNNLFIGTGLSVYDAWNPEHLQASGNVYLAGAKSAANETEPLNVPGFNPGIQLVEEQNAVYLELTLPETLTEQTTLPVTTKRLGKARVPDAAFTNPDGTTLSINADYYGKKREPNPSAGPFQNTGSGTLKLKVWPKAESEEPPTRSYAPRAAVEAWKDLRFGMFIHWGPVALTGHEIGWSRGGQTPIEEYDNLYKRFNPENFDADEWVRVAKAAGMKYMVLTTKHHDGFCLWPSEFTDYDIGETTFKRDVVGELAEACRKGGIGFGTYYSVCDWWHPLYPKGGRAGTVDKPTGDMDKYIEHLQNQTAELIKNYGPLTTMWFDVPRDVKWYHNEPTIEMMRELQPNLVVNNRAYYDKDVADYETPEQNLGTFNRDRPWETCMTIARQWAWKPNDPVKSLEQCLHGLIYSAGGDGNFLFNVGPNALGEIEPEQIQRLEEMGEWVNRYSDGIHATRGGPFKPSGWGASTHKGNDIYLFIARWPAGGIHKLPMVGTRILKAENRSGKTVELKQTSDGYALTVPESDRDPVATVIKLTVEKPASSIEPMDMGTVTGALSFRKPSSSSSIRWNQQSQGPQQAFDDNPGSHWVPGGKDEEWLAVDLEKPQTVNTVKIQQYAAHLKELSLQFEQGGEWKTVFSETDVKGDIEKTFEPVKAQNFRLLLKGGHTHLSEFQLY
ncbi:alpha-L-fucosidase [Pontiellaceae bacterium B12227]|nr:alpha-L-fucosidase [Pontiellaceae bacterium B12227]